MISYVLPTRDRPEHFARTLIALGALPPHRGEVIVADNASASPVVAPARLKNGLGVSVVRRPHNEGAAARNAGVQAADPASGWIIMLDDDSQPTDLGFLNALEEQPRDVLAVQAEIHLAGTDGPDAGEPGGLQTGPNRRCRESGGLPEVFIGCGVAIRREAFLDLGGYDPAFDYYGEEYDLCARILLAGGRVAFDRRFRVVHDKTGVGRDMDLILRRLVRNNCWVMQRYAPASARRTEISRTIKRYGRIAMKERATIGYARGMLDLSTTLGSQKRHELPQDLWDRFTGKAAALEALRAAWSARHFRTAVIAAPGWGGKNEHVIREALDELGVSVVDDEAQADAVVIGTMSPGPILDAWEMLAADHRVVLPWRWTGLHVRGIPRRPLREAAAA